MSAYLYVSLIGAFVGSAELVTRYRDEPLKLAAVPSAWFYVALNAAASSGALAIVRAFNWNLGAAPGTVEIAQVIAAGFGAMVVLRSHIFNLKIEDRDVMIGPSAVVTALLAAADRGVDRIRAISRSRHAATVMRGVSFDSARQVLALYSLAMLQNVPAAEQKSLSDAIEAVARSQQTDKQKALNLGLILMNVVGPAGLEEIVRVHADEISSDSAE